MNDMIYKEQVHREILREFPLCGRAPTVDELAEILGHMSVIDIHQALDELERDDAVFREEGRDEIVAAYPYSSRPTTHSVTFADGSKVWAMCAIDALGIHFMTGQNIAIDSIAAQSGLPIRIELKRGKVFRVEPSDVVVWRTARRSSETHDAITCCPGTNFFIPGGRERPKGEETGELISLPDAIERSINIFGDLLS